MANISYIQKPPSTWGEKVLVRQAKTLPRFRKTIVDFPPRFEKIVPVSIKADARFITPTHLSSLFAVTGYFFVFIQNELVCPSLLVAQNIVCNIGLESWLVSPQYPSAHLQNFAYQKSGLLTAVSKPRRHQAISVLPGRQVRVLISSKKVSANFDDL